LFVALFSLDIETTFGSRFSVLDEYTESKLHELIFAVKNQSSTVRRRAREKSVALKFWDPTPMLTQVAAKIQNRQDREDIQAHCGGWCVSSLLTDFLEIAGVMIGFQCQPFNLVTFWVLGYVTLVDEMKLTWHEAFLVLGQMWTSVGYGSHTPDESNLGMKLWHGFHAWAGVLLVNPQFDAATSLGIWALDDMIANTHRPRIIHLDTDKKNNFKKEDFTNKIAELSTFFVNIRKKVKDVCSQSFLEDFVFQKEFGKEMVKDEREKLDAKIESVGMTVNFGEWQLDKAEVPPVPKKDLVCSNGVSLIKIKFGDKDCATLFDDDSVTDDKEGINEKDFGDKSYVFWVQTETHCVFFAGRKQSDPPKPDSKADKWMLEHSREYRMYLQNTWKRRVASVVILLFEVTVTGLIYAADLKPADKQYKDYVFDAIYLAMMTFSTVGYGDYSPQTSWGQLFSPLMMQAGTAAFGSAMNRLLNDEETVEEIRDFANPEVTKVPEPEPLWDGLTKWIKSCRDISMMPKQMNEFWHSRK